jgi:uncharacterized protein
MTIDKAPKAVALSTALFAIAVCVAFDPLFADVPPIRGLRQVNHADVELEGGFWGARQDIHHEVTVPHALDCLEKAGHVTNFDKAAGTFDGPLRGNHAFDSDIHKALEGALYCLGHYDNQPLAARVENIIDRIVAAQQDDGFLISCFIVKDQDKRWGNLRMQHQTYNAGHFFEMAVEHHRLTGDETVLNAAIKFADHIDSIFGEGKRYDVGGHQEIELALIKLYRVTGDRRYLDLSKFFLDERGHVHGTERKRFDPNTLPPYPPNVDHLPESERRRALFVAKWSRRSGRMQDHKPLVEQDATGHAVRAGYTYATMADLLRFMDAPDYERALDRIWKDVVFRKMYITGSVGTAQYSDEGYGDPYLLPNKTYCESCANIAHVLWQQRMATLKAHAKYADVMELALYNGAISGISIEGDAFFYQNPLQSKGAKRSSWIGLACCPTNFTRFTPQVGGFMYAVGKEDIYVNLYAASTASIKIQKGKTVKIEQKTDYPWDGNVKLTVTPQGSLKFTLFLRIPGWAKGHPVPSDLYHFADSSVKPVTLKVNGKPVDAVAESDGYVHLKRKWKKGDVVTLDIPMPVNRVYAHEKIEADQGKVSLMRGPIVYCLEVVDNPEVDFSTLQLPRTSVIKADHRPDLLKGVTVLQGEVMSGGQVVDMTAIPYYAWANRAKDAMTVWIDETAQTPKSAARKTTGNAPIKVFILAGQSNMEGQGVVSMDHPQHYNGGKGNLVWSMQHSASAEKMKRLKDDNGKWVVRDDVEISFKGRGKLRKGGLTIGYTGYGGSSHIGPELQFGHVIGDHFDDPVLLIKTAWGGKSLYVDFRSPSSGGEVGPYYTKMIEEVYAALAELNYDNFDLTGFVWMQGWNDMCTKPAIPEYAENLVNLAKDIRKEFNVPDLPFIVGELGNGGPVTRPGAMADFRTAQRQGTARIQNAVFVETTAFARPKELSPNTGHGHHWFGNAESYFLVGDALAKATIDLIEKDQHDD